MSCIGIDVGNVNSVVAIARRGGIDVLANEVSKRQTATMVSFSGKERKLGEAAASAITSNLKNTVTGLKAIIGKKFHSEEIQREIPLVAYGLLDKAGDVAVPVQYNDEELLLTPEKCMSMLLKCLQKIAMEDQNAPVTDVVMAVPAYFTDAERHAMLDACNIAGLNCLRLMNDVTAAALSYGIYKTDLPADKATYVAFVDVGAMDTTVSIVSFVKGKLTVLSTACDRHLGGRDFDMILANHFAAEWKEKHKVDAHTNKKAMYRLLVACEKTKKVLSANPQSPINVECFMDDIDVKGVMDRDLFLELAEPFFVQLDALLEEAFLGSGLAKDDITTVEVIGGSCRIPSVQSRIATFFSLETCSKTLNFDECVAKGCALQCAMLSPAFKVRDFSVNDVTLYPVALSWSGSGGVAAADDAEMDDGAEAPAAEKAGGSSTVVFSKFNPVPNTKMLTFYRKETFSLTAAYDESVKLPLGFPTKLSEFTVSDIPPRAAGEDGTVDPAKIKVKLRLDIHGCVALESAVAIEEQEIIVEEPVAPPPVADAPPAAEGDAAAPPAAEGDAAEGDAAAAEGDAAAAPPAVEGDAAAAPPAAEAAEGDAAAPPAAEGDAAAPTVEKKKKKKVTRVALSVVAKGSGITQQQLMEAQEAEGNMSHMDDLIQATSAAMNELESSIYTLRDSLSQRLEKFLTDADREKFGSELTAMEDWLYDDGFDAEKSVYEAKLKELKANFAPGEARAYEAEMRPSEANKLEDALNRFGAFARSTDEEYAHIEAEQRAKVTAECEAARAWLTEAQAKLETLVKTEDPPVKASEFAAKASSLAAACEPIMNTPKPLPMEPEPEPAAEGDAAAAEGAEADGAEPAADAPKAEPAAEVDTMDVD